MTRTRHPTTLVPVAAEPPRAGLTWRRAGGVEKRRDDACERRHLRSVMRLLAASGCSARSVRWRSSTDVMQ